MSESLIKPRRKIGLERLQEATPPTPQNRVRVKKRKRFTPLCFSSLSLSTSLVILNLG